VITLIVTGSLVLLFSVSVWGQANNCDLNLDGKVDVADVQAVINMTLGLAPCTANIAGANVCDAVVVQRVINASLGGECVTSAGIRTVTLTWTASTSPDVVGYNVLRGTTSGGPYTILSSLGLATSYTDDSVESGSTYYYVITAVDGSGRASPYSKQVTAVVKVP
jgi:hypothetical protein